MVALTSSTATPNEKLPLLDEEFDVEIPAGIAPEAYYDSQLTPLRAAIRRFLLPYIRSETPILHRMQVIPILIQNLQVDLQSRQKQTSLTNFCFFFFH